MMTDYYTADELARMGVTLQGDMCLIPAAWIAPPRPVKQRSADAQRAYNRTQRKNWAGRRKALGGKRIA